MFVQDADHLGGRFPVVVPALQSLITPCKCLLYSIHISVSHHVTNRSKLHAVNISSPADSTRETNIPGNLRRDKK